MANRQLTHRQLISLIIVFLLGAFTVVGYETVAPAKTSAWLAVIIAMSIMFYTRTPLWVFYFSLYALCLAAALGGLITVGRIGEIATPLLVLVVFFVSFTLLFSPNISFGHLFPLFIPYVQSKQGVLQDLAKGILLGGSLIIIISFLNILAFGTARLEEIGYASALMLRNIQVGGFIERLESSIAIAWLLVLFVEGLIVFYAAGLSANQTFNLKNMQITWIPVIIPAFPINWFILNSEFDRSYVDTVFTPYSFVFQLIIPASYCYCPSCLNTKLRHRRL